MSSQQQTVHHRRTGLPVAGPPEVVELVRRRSLRAADRAGRPSASATTRSGCSPTTALSRGPCCRCPRARVLVDIENQGDMEATVHWHGLRLDNRYDGTHQTQAPIQVGGRFTAVIECPDPGAYWYHPHIRSDYGIEMGLYGGIVVEPADPDYWPPVHRELFLTLDDLLLEEGQVAPFSREETTMPRWGASATCCSSNGETDLALTAQRGEVLRLYLTEHGQHPRVQRRAAGCADEAGRRGQRPRRAARSGSRRSCSRPRSGSVVDVMFDAAGELTLSTAPRTGPTPSPPSRCKRSRPNQSLAESYDAAAQQPRTWWLNVPASGRTWRRRRTRRSPSSPR